MIQNHGWPWMAQIIFVIYLLKHGKHGDFPQLR